jgi:hypothetical protein
MLHQFLVTTLLLASVAAYSSNQDTVRRIAAAPVDEWFYGVGSEKNTWLGGQLPNARGVEVPQGAIAKRNGGYVWAMTAAGNNLWFSSLNNGWCGWMMVSLNILPSQSSQWVCETYKSQFSGENIHGDSIADASTAAFIQRDWRPPQIFWRNSTSGVVHEVTSDDPSLQKIISKSFGFRAAGSADGVVFMASNPLVRSDDAVFLLAFDGTTGEFIQGTTLKNYVNVRRFLTLDHDDGSTGLYLLVGAEMHSSDYPNHLLRWTGSREQPFQAASGHPNTPGFEVVGDLQDAGVGAELLSYSNRLLVTTWGGENTAAALLQSNPIPPNGFTHEARARFKSVFNIADFEPDPIIAKAWLLGAIEVYEDKIYWGTMHPGAQAFTHLMMKHPSVLLSADEAVRKSHRQTHLFRTDLTDPDDPVTELLYGEERYWVYDNGHWRQKENLLGLSPLFGKSGYGNMFNEYTWTLKAYGESLYVGTFDISGPMQLFRRGIDCAITCFALESLAAETKADNEQPGFDLLRFDSADSPAVVVTKDGFGHVTSTGVRNAVIVDDTLYLGTASSANLDSAGGQAGWGLFEVKKPLAAGNLPRH